MPDESYWARHLKETRDYARETLGLPPTRKPGIQRKKKRAGRPDNSARDEEIRNRYEQGETLSVLAKAYGISGQRIWQIAVEEGGIPSQKRRRDKRKKSK